MYTRKKKVLWDSLSECKVNMWKLLAIVDLHVDELTNGLTFFDRCEDGEDKKKFRPKRKDFIILWGRGRFHVFSLYGLNIEYIVVLMCIIVHACNAFQVSHIWVEWPLYVWVFLHLTVAWLIFKLLCFRFCRKKILKLWICAKAWWIEENVHPSWLFLILRRGEFRNNKYF